MTRLREKFFPSLLAAELKRRLHLFRVLLIVQLGATALLVGVTIVDTRDYPEYVLLSAGLCVAVSAISVVGFFLARREAFHLGASFLVFSLLSVLGFFTAFYGTRGPVPFILIWPIIATAILLEPPMTLVTTALAALIYGVLSFLELYQLWPVSPGTLPIFREEFYAFWHLPEDVNVTLRYVSDTANVMITYFATAFLTWIASSSLRQAARRSQEQAAELESYRAELEEMVSVRTAELRQTTANLRASLAEIRELGSPVLPIFEGIMLAPLIGTIDSARARLVMDRVLHQVAQERARVVILDITAVPVVDTSVANALLRTAQGAKLLGATPILVGVRAEVAETMVSLGVDLRGIVTRASLQAGLEYALKTMGVQITAEEGSSSSVSTQAQRIRRKS